MCQWMSSCSTEHLYRYTMIKSGVHFSGGSQIPPVSGCHVVSRVRSNATACYPALQPAEPNLTPLIEYLGKTRQVS